MKRAGILFSALCSITLLASASPAAASVRDGVDAWSAGEYEMAVAMWAGPASAGDPDALFNLGQAYRLGRGVVRDMARAQDFYRQAADEGHFRAADIYGLMLFQEGRHEEAMPYVTAAAGRGDPRAQYLLGIAHFNGRLVTRDWERAYALLTLANSAGLPQAAPAITRMDRHIPLTQRQNAAELAVKLQAEAEQARNQQFASADLGVTEMGGPVPGQTAAPRVAGRVSAETGNRAVPQRIETAQVTPSVVASSAAIREARMANGTASPANAGASYARPQEIVRAPVQVAVAPASAPEPAPRYAAAPQSPAPEPAAPAAPSRFGGEWRVQLGAFGVAANAERLWSRVSGQPELRGSTKMLVPAGRVTKLQAGGYASRADAQAACNALKASGQDCLVTR